MHHSTFAREKAFDAAGAIGGELIGGGLGFATGTVAGYDKARIGDGTDEWSAFVDGLSVLLVRVEGETKFALEIIANYIDIAHELMPLRHWYDDKEIVDVTSVMFVAEIESDKTVELVEKNIRNKLASKIADDDAAAGFAVKKALVDRKGIPIFLGAANDNIFHGVVIDDLMPEKFDGLIQLFAIVGMAANIILEAVDIGKGKWVLVALKLAIKPPDDAFEKFVMIKTNEIALDIESNRKGGLSVVFCNLTDVMSEAFLTKKYTFAFATRIRIFTKAAIPPVGADVVKKMVNDAITKWSGDDFTGNWFVDDESYTSAGLITATNNTVSEKKDVFHVINLEAMFVNGFALAFAGDLVSTPEFAEQEFFKTRILRHD